MLSINDHLIKISDLLFFIFAYAEIHYRFPFLPFSRYFNKEPEILCDLPHRIEFPFDIPLTIFIKDADRYPVTILEVSITQRNSRKVKNHEPHIFDEIINQHWWVKQFFLKPISTGFIELSVDVTYSVRNKRKKITNHNYLHSSTSTLRTYVSETRLPGSDRGWIWGDLHYHSNYGEDFVEYGAPLDVTQISARAIGLSFIGITDHSYNLDDKPGAWYNPDPELKRWNQMKGEIAKLNNHFPLLIPGEEVSCRNTKNRNVHALVLNHPNFIHGSGDSGEKWFNHHCEHSISDIVKMKTVDSLIIAAHPGMSFSFLERLLLKRGGWENADYQTPNIDGFQILNGYWDRKVDEAKERWVKCLLKGEKKFICAGNDAHGNFNRFRQVKFPMLSLWDHDRQILGKCRTGIKIDNHQQITISSMLSSIKNGESVISDGPLLEINVKRSISTNSLTNTETLRNIEITLTSISSVEFGNITSLVLYSGIVGETQERVIYQNNYNEKEYSNTTTVIYSSSITKSYIRGELTTLIKSQEHRCYTNAIWL